ncbi:MAG: GIY-YIG nuclease family protein [Pseudomonadota bacterium]
MFNERRFYIYVMANRKNGTIYVGMTRSLAKRIYQHQLGSIEGFTKRYGLKRLVYYEVFPTAVGAIQREKNIKKWPRRWKIEMIEKRNPEWQDLSKDGLI